MMKDFYILILSENHIGLVSLHVHVPHLLSPTISYPTFYPFSPAPPHSAQGGLGDYFPPIS